MKTPSLIAPRRRLRRAPWTSLCALVVLALAGEVKAIDCYMKLDGIPGEITSGNFEGWSKIGDVTTKITTSPAADPPVPAALAIMVSKPPDRTSPLLALHCASGGLIPRLNLVCLDNSTVFLRITLRDVMVSSVTVQGADGPPGESVGFTYQKIEWSCLKEDFATGGLTSTFDALTQQGGTKVRPPFVANLVRRAGEAGLHVTCPVEGGHRYRLASNTSLTGPWKTLLEFTATEDGVADHTVELGGGPLFLRIDEVE